jgi:hypothetical protein
MFMKKVDSLLHNFWHFKRLKYILYVKCLRYIIYMYTTFRMLTQYPSSNDSVLILFTSLMFTSAIWQVLE